MHQFRRCLLCSQLIHVLDSYAIFFLIFNHWSYISNLDLDSATAARRSLEYASNKVQTMHKNRLYGEMSVIMLMDWIEIAAIIFKQAPSMSQTQFTISLHYSLLHHICSH